MHTEVVPKLDTDSCLNAMMRFMARSGKPSTIISDIGTNFVGAKREFLENVAAWNKEGIKEHQFSREPDGSSTHPQHPTLDGYGNG